MEVKEVVFGKNGDKIRNVFHYTSPEGLYSILSNCSFRFTDCQFFNDRSEYVYIKEPLKCAINDILGSLKNNNLIESVDKWLNEEYQVLEKKVNVAQRYYVFCASMDDDSLNMWNYYVKSGKYQGYNIGISIEKLIDYAKNINLPYAEMWHGAIIYDQDMQNRIIVNMIKKIDNRLWNIKKEVSYTDYWYCHLQEAQTEIMESIELYRLFFKAKAFENEREYRFVFRLPVGMENSEYFIPGFQVKNGVLSPYFDFVFAKNILDSIIISPMIEEQIARRGIELYINRDDYKNIDIRTSSIPIRY